MEEHGEEPTQSPHRSAKGKGSAPVIMIKTDETEHFKPSACRRQSINQLFILFMYKILHCYL